MADQSAVVPQDPAPHLADVYPELRRLAHGFLVHERPGHTLQTTDLVHEAFVRLSRWRGGGTPAGEADVALFVRAMRQELVDHARRRCARKRGGDREHIPYQCYLAQYTENPLEVLALDEALTRLEAINARQARVVELRHFGGLSELQIAELLDVAPRTVRQDWRYARLWLRAELGRGDGDEHH